MSKLLDLLLPTPCIFCQKTGAAMCNQCVRSFDVQRSNLAKGAISGYSFSDYSTQSAAVVNAIKEQGQTSLIKFMAEFMLRDWPQEYREVLLVPIPSTNMNLKQRGFSHTEILANQLSRALGSVKVATLLKSAKARSDQVGLSFAEREQNLIGAFKGDLRGFQGKRSSVVLLDDVFTSGATLAQAWSTLEELGVHVVGFCVFAQISPRKPLFPGHERLS